MTAIEDRIDPSALLRPTCYNNPGRLRFELSTGDSVVAQFLTAHRKAHAVCMELFADDYDSDAMAETFVTDAFNPAATAA